MTKDGSLVASTLARLRSAADEAERGWHPAVWNRLDAEGSDILSMRSVQSPLLSGAATFDDLRLEPGEEVTLSTRLNLPPSLAGVPIAGHPLVMSMHSYYPTSLAVDGRPVFEDDQPPVACGPALFELVPALASGDSGELTLVVHAPANQVRGDGFILALTTPELWARFIALDTAWAQLLLASELAVTNDELKAVEAASAGLPERLLELDETALSAALAALADALSPVSPRVADRRVHAIGHSHIDLQWQWTWADTREVIRRDVRSVLSLMDEFPEMTFTHSQPAGYELLRQEEPELFAAVRDRVAEGRWEPATLQWVESDVNLVSGEAQVRQLLEGVRWTRRHLGTTPTVHLAPDTFGHAGNLPQLTTSAGAKVYYHHRGNPGQASGGRMWPAYWWAGDDGTRLLSCSTPVYLGPLTPGRVARDVLALTSDEGLSSCLYFYGVGDHGGGPARRDLQTLRAMRGVACLPDIFCSTLDAFAKEVVASGVSLPEHRGESPTIFEGCYTSHADVKHDNRMAENELIAAETLATLAGQDRTEEISETWRTVLFHQFHDIICGSSIKEAYEFTGAELSRATVRARSIADEALKSLQGAVPPGEIGVTNPLGFSRTDVVLVPELSGEGAAVLVDDEGVPVPGQAGPDGLRFLARVPAFATVAYRLAEGTPKAAAISIGDEDARYLTVETAHFFAMVRRDSGIVTTLFDRGADRELVGYNIARAVNCEQVRPDLALGVLQLLEEYPHAMASWVVDEVHTELSLIAGAELRVVECGPVRAVLETRHQIRSSNVVKRVVFYAGLPRIDIELEVQWNEPGGPALGIPGLALAFTTRQQEADAYYETPFAANRRPSDGLVVPALRWADIGGRSYGLAVLNDGKYGFDALGTRVRAHIIRSAYDPDGVSDVGRLDSSRFSLVPHTGHWSEAGIVEHAAGFNNPLRARVSGARESGARESDAARSFDTGWRPHLQEPGTVVIDALKFAHRGDGSRIIRLHESAGRPARTRLTGLPPGSPVFAASVVEDVIRRLEATDGELELVFRPFEVKTLLLAP